MKLLFTMAMILIGIMAKTYLVMLFFNYLAPTFSLPQITIVQAFFIHMLTSLLVGRNNVNSN